MGVGDMDKLLRELDRLEQRVYRIEDNSLADHFLALIHVVERLIQEQQRNEETKR